MLNSGRLKFYYPIPRFPSVSVTGVRCDLGCNHCKGHYLRNMPDVSSPEKLREFCINHQRRGGIGLLVSGGSTKAGRVPLKSFTKVLRWVKDNTDLIVNLHTGMLNENEAEEIASTGIDIASVDVVGSRETLREVYGLDVTVDEYNETLSKLADAGVYVAPHICVGLHFGGVVGELKAIEFAAQVEPEVIVFLSLIPTLGTPMERVRAPSVDAIIYLINEARRMSPISEISLGCMRSSDYKVELEQKAVKAGVSRVAMASRSTEKWAAEDGYIVKRMDGCCATPRSLEDKVNSLLSRTLV